MAAASRIARFSVLGAGQATNIVIAVLLLVAVFGPALAPYDPLKLNFQEKLNPPSADHWFGTDELGRDVLSRTVFAARVSLLAAAQAVLIALVMGLEGFSLRRFLGLLCGMCAVLLIAGMSFAGGTGEGKENTAAPELVVQLMSDAPPDKDAVTEAINLAAVALRAGKKVDYDTKSMKITNDKEANQYLTREYRKGWEL
mgnify:CR=1 FL=1